MSTHEFLTRARAHFDRGELHETVTICQRGLLAAPTVTEARLLLGRALMRLQRYSEVLAEMRVVLEREPANPYALSLKGEAQLRKGEVGKAAQTLLQAQHAAPDDPAIVSLRTQAENALSGEANPFIFVDEDPSTTMTRHYPVRGGVPGQPDPSRVPPHLRPQAPSRGPQAPSRPPPELNDDADAAALMDDLLETRQRVRTPDLPSARPSRAGGTMPFAAAKPTGSSAPNFMPEDQGAVEDVTDVYSGRPSAPGNLSGHAATRASQTSAPGASTVGYRKLPPQEPPRPASPPAQREPEQAGDSSEMTFVAADLLGGGRAGQPDPLPAPVASVGPPIAESSEELSMDSSEFSDEMVPTAMIPADSGLKSLRESSRLEEAARRSVHNRPIGEAPTVEARSPLRPSQPGPTGAAHGHQGMGQPAPLEPPPPPGMAPDAGTYRPAPEPVAADGHVSDWASADLVDEAPAGLGLPASAPPMYLDDEPRVAPLISPPAPAMPASPAPRPERPMAAPDDGYDPTMAVPRQSAGGGRIWQYLLVAAVVVAGGVVAGLQIRELRLDWEVTRARRAASAMVARDTYAGYMRARAVYDAISGVQVSVRNQAAAARIRAALAAEFGQGQSEAQAAVARLEQAELVDALAARAYVALVDDDAGAALAQAQAVAARNPDDGLGSYLTGRAQLLGGRSDEAVRAFERAIEVSPRPLYYVGLGRAHMALGQHDQADAAFAAALELVPGHPTAVLARAQLALESGRKIPDGLEAELDALIEEGNQPPDAQPRGVSPAQVVEAALHLVSLRSKLGDNAGARAALDRVRAMQLGDDPGFTLALIEVLERLGDTAAAVDEAKRAAARWPERLDVRLTLADVALRVDAVGEAQAALEVNEDTTLAESISRSPRALATRGRVRLALGDVDAALADLDAALDARPDLPEALLARAEIDLRRGAAKDAVKRLAPLVGKNAPMEVRVTYAAALRASGQSAQARKAIDALLSDAAEDGRVHLELGRLERDQGRLAQAREAFTKAAELMPEDPVASLELTRLLLDSGDRARARADIAALVERVDDNAEALLEAARIHTFNAQLDRAQAYLVRAAELAQVSKAALARERGRLVLRRGDPKAAVELLGQALEADAGDADTLVLMVEARIAAGDAEGARAVQRELSLMLGEETPTALLTAAMVAAATDDVDGALATYAKVDTMLDEDQASPRLRARAAYWEGVAQFKDDHLRDARKVLERAVALDPQYAQAWFLLGKVEYGRGKLDDAADAFEEAVELDPEHLPEAWFYLGEVHVELDHERPAKKALRRYLELDADGPRARDAKRYLDELD
ncbi:tetratricopeptide repeat protein [Haliangium sp.]|uniref:tetratricopeptide repeat protein n=1 Tax=Haliangium sp. TaxID=2663208 RepID=UPI003D0A6149